MEFCKSFSQDLSHCLNSKENFRLDFLIPILSCRVVFSFHLILLCMADLHLDSFFEPFDAVGPEFRPWLFHFCFFNRTICHSRSIFIIPNFLSTFIINSLLLLLLNFIRCLFLRSSTFIFALKCSA